jgi:hypothetical protein
MAAARITAASIRADPVQEIAASVPDRAANLNERRAYKPNPPRLERPDGEAQEVSRVIFSQQTIGVMFGFVGGHVVTASISMQQD